MHDLFSNINSILNNIQWKIALVEDITETLEVQEKQVVDIKEELASQRFRLDLVANVMIRQKEIISSLGSKMLSMEICSIRKNILIVGIKEPLIETKEERSRLVQQSNIEIEIIEPYQIWNSERSTRKEWAIVAKLANFEHKMVIFSKASNFEI